MSRQTGQSAAPLTVSRQTGRSAGTTYCVQTDTQAPLTDCIQAETTPLTDSVQAETTPLTDSVPHAIPIKVWTQQTDGDLLEVAAEIAEGHPELSIITGLHLDLPLGGLIHPLPVHVADTGRKFAYQPSP